MTALDEAAESFPQGEYREAAASVFAGEVEPLLIELLTEAFEEFVDSLRRIQGRRGESSPEYLARKLVREVIQPRIDPVLAIAVREKQLKRLDRQRDLRRFGLDEDSDPLMLDLAEVMNDRLRRKRNR